MKKNFTKEVELLHNNIVAEIISIMAKHNVQEVDLLGNDCDHAQLLGFPDTEEPMLLEVNKVYCEGNQLKLDVILDVDTSELSASNENGDIGEAYKVYSANDFTHILACGGIASVYDAVYQVLELGKIRQ